MSINVEVDSNGVALLTIDRPEKANALDAEHYEALSLAWRRVRDDSDIRVAIITGAGNRVFSAGADLKSWVGRDEELGGLWHTQANMLLNRGLEIWKPVIAAVNGACVGGGMTLLLATDIRVCSEHATFGVAEVKRGIIAANGGSQRLIQQLPHAIAMEMLLTGDSIDAETALRWGLVNKVVASSDLLDASMEYAQRIAANAPLAIQATKELALRSGELGLSAGLRMEQLVQHILKSSDDSKEGAAAFQDKRPPYFTNS